MARCAVKFLSAGEQIGLLCTVVACGVSLVAVLAVFAGLAYKAIRSRQQPGRRSHILSTHLDVYLISLLLSDLLQAVGGIVSLRWIHDGAVTCGQLCDAQGVFKMIGDPGTSMFTLAITVHTFSVIVLGWTPPHNFRIPIAVVIVSWAYRVLLLGVAKATESPDAYLFGPTPYWCWFAERYQYGRIPGSFLWYWLSMGSSILLYVPVYLRIRGNLHVEGVWRWRLTTLRRAQMPQRIDGRFNPVLQSRKMLLYPIVYTVLIVPFSVLRWIVNFTRVQHVAAPLYFLFISIFYLGGLANVLLLVFTRPNVLGFSREGGARLIGEEPDTRHHRQPAVEDETVASEETQAW